MRCRRAGLTFIELVVILSIVVVFAAIGLLAPVMNRDKRHFDGAVAEIVVLLREARLRSMSQSSSSVWGVHFENSTSTRPFFALFYGSYGASTETVHRALPAGVEYSTSSLSQGASRDIIFNQIVGTVASVPSPIVLKSVRLASVSSTIVVASSGLVSY